VTDASEMDEFLTLRDSDTDDEDPELVDVIPRSKVEIYGV
jgi:hypothetical protein